LKGEKRKTDLAKTEQKRHQEREKEKEGKERDTVWAQ